MSEFICQFCERPAPNKGAHVKHEKHCHQNPNYVKGYRSPKAGQQKGSIPWNQGKSQGRHPNWDEKYALEKVLVQNSTYARTNLKKRLIRDKIIEYKCACCGIGPEWNGKPMPLILDHINGVNNDNRLENLRFVCSNCDTQLDTYKSRNRRNKRRVNCSGSSTVLKTVGTLTGMEFDSTSPPPNLKGKHMSKDCGCGRSPTGKCIGWHNLTNELYEEKKAEYDKKQLNENAPQLLKE